MHVRGRSAILFGYGLAWSIGHFGALVVAMLAWLVAVLLGSWLDRANRRGPMETLMRRAVA